MAISHGSFVARTVSQVSRFCPVGSWVQLCADGVAPLTGRNHIRIAPRGRDTIRLALKYVARAVSSDGTVSYTTPTSTASDATVVSSEGIYVEPIGDNVAVFGRAVQNGGSSGGLKVIVTEYA